jgi:hypothetical protein
MAEEEVAPEAGPFALEMSQRLDGQAMMVVAANGTQNDAIKQTHYQPPESKGKCWWWRVNASLRNAALRGRPKGTQRIGSRAPPLFLSG